MEAIWWMLAVTSGVGVLKESTRTCCQKRTEQQMIDICQAMESENKVHTLSPSPLSPLICSPTLLPPQPFYFFAPSAPPLCTFSPPTYSPAPLPYHLQPRPSSLPPAAASWLSPPFSCAWLPVESERTAPLTVPPSFGGSLAHTGGGGGRQRA